MTHLSDTVRFCFPASSPPPPELPLNTRPYTRNEAVTDDTHSNSNMARGPAHAPRGSDSSQYRPDAINWGRQERADLAKDIIPFAPLAILRSYAPDWLLAALLWGVLAILNKSGGHKREFSLNDISIQHSHAVHERVPPFLLGIISAGIPLAILVPLSLFIGKSRWDTHNAVIGLFMSYTMTGVVTQIIKMSVGRPRPDLIARCLPREGAADHPVFGLSTVEICTSTNKLVLDDGFKSFPSGHSSLSFAGLGFLSLYLAGKMHLWDVKGHRTRAWFALSPLLGGIMVAISRTEDNRHHWQDVLVGSLLGLFIAWVSYRTYYPKLSHRQCHLPLAPKFAEADDEETARGDRVRLLSEEEGARPRASEEEVAWRS
ncbi:phospholipid metabolism-related protein [Papiliotrema laurentii]|uniref:Phospholipid metabolism-related protein n=1 Tax=Papiliotrema laurentii TaxID=5418 RepID=A0AAD9CYA9_PAPLA|nr:phospholipid metabolism-related protein [Papiliotrema laurentii]